MANSHEEIIAALRKFYSAIIRLPYIDADALVLPPPEGWSGVNADELRKRGKTEGVIKLLRHLPYLRNPSKYRKWMLSPDTLAIAYCDGEVYDPLMDELQPIPAHCIWLTENDSRNGIDLILDTHTGSITEWSMLEGGLRLDYGEYEKMDKADRWMCYPTMPAVDFFNLWQARWEKLVWIPVYNPNGGPATASWWYRAIPGSGEEEYILTSDSEYKPTDDEDDDEDDESENVDSTAGSAGHEVHEVDEGDEGDAIDSGDENASDTAVSDREVEDILGDAFGEESQTMRTKFTSAAEEDVGESISTSGQEVDVQAGSMLSPQQEAEELYTIFQRNGWPDHFNRGQCIVELHEFQQSRRR
ncbi:hypothetical protein F4861DRAFT_535910 [Xylaria intraflava]|nr:hypothetical protein F4861DRAFT_535910 [Xylaria intraflava]